jgi:hypothetical protein
MENLYKLSVNEDPHIFITTDEDTKGIIGKWVKNFVFDLNKCNNLYQKESSEFWYFSCFPVEKRDPNYLNKKILEILTSKELEKEPLYGRIVYYTGTNKRTIKFTKMCENIKDPKWRYNIKMEYIEDGFTYKYEVEKNN